MANNLRLAAFLERSAVNGPGLRAVVWAQGCSRRCPGCFNPGMLDFDGGQDVAVAELAEKILALGDIDGITLSGGEPLAQAGALAELAAAVRRRGLNVVLFTGYTAAELTAVTDPDQRKLLESVDMAIAGPYRQDLPVKRYLCGSDNQELLFFTDVLRQHPDVLAGDDPVVEFSIGPDGKVCVSGLLR